MVIKNYWYVFFKLILHTYIGFYIVFWYNMCVLLLYLIIYNDFAIKIRKRFLK